MEPMYIIVLFALMILTLAVTFLSKGFALPAIMGLLTIAITATTFTSPDIYAEILFAPYTQLMIIIVSIFCMYGAVKNSN